MVKFFPVYEYLCREYRTEYVTYNQIIGSLAVIFETSDLVVTSCDFNKGIQNLDVCKTKEGRLLCDIGGNLSR